MRKTLTCLSLLVASLVATSSYAADTLSIYGGKDNSEFLGCLTCDKKDPKSSLNASSKYGIHNRKGVWRETSPYRNQYSKLSACNSYANNPPVIKNQDGQVITELSTNQYSDNSVCSLTRPNTLCKVVTAICESH